MTEGWRGDVLGWLHLALENRQAELADLHRLIRQLERETGQTVREMEGTAASPARSVPGSSPAAAPVGAAPASGKRNGHPVSVPKVRPEALRREELLLILASGGRWVGFPWNRVDRVSLAADAPVPVGSASRFSLATLLGLSPVPEEAFAIQFSHDGGRAVLTCERVGDLLPVQEVGPEVDRVLWPAHLAGAAPPGWEPVVTSGSDTVAPAPVLPEPVEVAAPVPALPEPVEAAAPAPVLPEPVEVAAPVPVLPEPVEAAAAVAHGASAEGVDSPQAAEELPAAERVVGAGETSGSLADATDSVDPTTPTRRADPFDTGASDPEWLVEAPAPAPEPDPAPRRALVAVRYLPARISVCRTLRQMGWTVEEIADLDRAADKLHPGVFGAIFVDVSQPLPGELRAAMHREDLAGLRWIAVGSRLRVVPEMPTGALAVAPRLFFPFGEEEARALIESL